MSYKYTLGDTGRMTHAELLEAVKAREIAPRLIVGTGYKNGRKVAIEWLQEMIEKEGAGLNK